MKKKLLFIVVCFLMGFVNVSAKEINLYFYPNGGNVTTENFSVGGYGYLSYNGTVFAKYTDNDTISNINSIDKKSFVLEKNGTSLVSGREWYTSVDGKTYFFSNSKTYKISDILASVGHEDDTFYSFDLYAHWTDKKKSSGTDISNVKPKATSLTISSSKSTIAVGSSITLSKTFKPSGSASETVTWTSSNKKVATVDSSGKVTGVSPGTVKITGKSKNGLKSTVTIQVKTYVIIQFHMNGGSIADGCAEKFSSSGQYVVVNASTEVQKIAYNGKTTEDGLYNYNKIGGLNIWKKGYLARGGAHWNTKADGTGKSYSQYTQYSSSDFCDASKKNCKITLYVNWVKTNFVVEAHTTFPALAKQTAEEKLKGNNTNTAQEFDIDDKYVYISKTQQNHCFVGAGSNAVSSVSQCSGGLKSVDIFRYSRNKACSNYPKKYASVQTLTNSGHGIVFDAIDDNGKPLMLVGVTDNSKNNGLRKLSDDTTNNRSSWIGVSYKIGALSFSEGTNNVSKLNSNKILTPKDNNSSLGIIAGFGVDEDNKLAVIKTDGVVRVFKYTLKNHMISFGKTSIAKYNDKTGTQGLAINGKKIYLLQNDGYKIYDYSGKLLKTVSIDINKLQKALKADETTADKTVYDYEPEGIKIINKKVYFGAKVYTCENGCVNFYIFSSNL